MVVFVVFWVLVVNVIEVVEWQFPGEVSLHSFVFFAFHQHTCSVA